MHQEPVACDGLGENGRNRVGNATSNEGLMSLPSEVGWHYDMNQVGRKVPKSEPTRMTQIVLNDDQLNAVRAAKDAVALRDAQGNLIGYISPPPSQEVIAEAKRRLHSSGPWFSTKEVLEHLNSLEQG